VVRHFDEGEVFVGAVDWATNEVLGNILQHAEAHEPGAVYAEFAPREHRIEVAICDLGRGILASLSERIFLRSHGQAISEALRRGVTRSDDIGQGNGLAGIREIVKQNGGSLRVWTGNTVLRLDSGGEHFTMIPALPGTGVALSLDTRRPVDLKETWIAERVEGWLDETSPAEATPSMMLREPGAVSRSDLEEGAAERRFDVAAACESTGIRNPAKRLREKILIQLARGAGPVILDFSGVHQAASSFLDELLGRLAAELGRQAFADRLRVRGMSDVIQRMTNVVIAQRTATGPGPIPPEGGAR
jgi:hypothetical protein